MEPVKLKLLDPIQFGSESVVELTVREPRAKDLRDLPVSPKTGDFLNLAAKLSAQPPSMIDMLSVRDAMKLVEVVGNFMVTGQ